MYRIQDTSRMRTERVKQKEEAIVIIEEILPRNKGKNERGEMSQTRST